MSSADQNPADGDPGRPSPGITSSDRKRGRIGGLGAVVAAVVLVFAFILLVSRCGGEGGEIYGLGAEAPVGTLASRV